MQENERLQGVATQHHARTELMQIAISRDLHERASAICRLRNRRLEDVCEELLQRSFPRLECEENDDPPRRQKTHLTVSVKKKSVHLKTKAIVNRLLFGGL